MRIFLSHSSTDSELASRIITLLRSCLNLRPADIRCTSVDGYRLPGGATTDERLRSEVHECELLIALLTPKSLKSPYVLFELGARWGSSRPLIPVLAAGASHSDLKAPLSGINALDIFSGAQIHQLIADTGDYLGINDLSSASSYTHDIEQVIETSQSLRSDYESESLGLSHVESILNGLVSDASVTTLDMLREHGCSAAIEWIANRAARLTRIGWVEKSDRQYVRDQIAKLVDAGVLAKHDDEVILHPLFRKIVIDQYPTQFHIQEVGEVVESEFRPIKQPESQLGKTASESKENGS